MYVCALMIVAMACENKKMQHDKQTAADTIVGQAFNAQDFDRALALIDSLEKTGDMSMIQASEKRGEAYLDKDMFKESEAEFRKAIDGTTPQNLMDSLHYFSAVANVVQHQALHGDEEAILNTAVPMLQTLADFKYPKEYAPHVLRMKLMLYTFLGTAQLGLDKYDEADKSYEQAFQVSMQLLKLSESMSTIYNAVAGLGSVTTNNLNMKRYEQAAYWLAKHDSLAPMAFQHKDMPEMYKTILKFIQDMNHMNLAVGLNHLDEAAHYYEEYKKSELYQNTDAQARAVNYLLASHHYAEAADILQHLDEVLGKYQVDPTLDMMGDWMTKKFAANLKSGRRDSALATATFVFENLDSAITRQKRSEAAKLATIYETQQKDEEIAQQQIELNRQRFLALAVALVLITAFFIVYTLFRRRAAKRMAEMKAQQERIESELRIARDIQMSMVPSTFPEREGLDMYAQMTPAKEVGGDLYGYVLIGDKLYFAVGDVSGKGVPASLFMAQATRLFRTLATQGMMPAEICTHMNDALSGDDNVNGMFVTFFLGLLDLQSGHLSFCNAGHNPPFIGGGESKGEFMQMEANAPIGLFPGIEYVGEEMESIKGRALFVYTDGLNEAEDTAQNQFGDDRLLEILRNTPFDTARQMIDTLTAEVEKHRQGAEPNDDMTMLCLRIS